MKPAACAAFLGARFLISQAAEFFFRIYFQKGVDEVFISCSFSRPSAEGTLPNNGCKFLCQSALNFGLNGPGSLKTELHNKQEPPEVSSFFVLAEPEEYNLANSNSVSV
jgi:hypothetical protein